MSNNIDKPIKINSINSNDILWIYLFPINNPHITSDYINVFLSSIFLKATLTSLFLRL